MKKVIMLFSAVVVLAFSVAALAQECTDLALAFSTDANSMAPRDLAALKRCVETKLREKLETAPSSGTGVRVPPPRPGSPVPTPAPPPPIRPPAPIR